MTTTTKTRTTKKSTVVSLFQELCNLVLFPKPNQGEQEQQQAETLNIRLDHCSSSGVRGIFANRHIPKDSVLFSIPLSSCLRDDDPPPWFWDRNISLPQQEGKQQSMTRTRTTTGEEQQQQENDGTEEKENLECMDDEQGWVTRLAASMLDVLWLWSHENAAKLTIQDQEQLQDHQPDHGDEPKVVHWQQRREPLPPAFLSKPFLIPWLALLPTASSLEACLPVHWSEEVLAQTRCPALEVAVDSTYFARARVKENLWERWNPTYSMDPASLKEPAEEGEEEEEEDLKQQLLSLPNLMEYALDLVQTRSCRIWLPPNHLVNLSENANDDQDGTITNHQNNINNNSIMGKPIRILAPIFDLINHHPNAVNAEFGFDVAKKEEKEEYFLRSNAISTKQQMQEQQQILLLRVRAVKNIAENEQVFIDYGDSARPDWKCLLSYGFVPEYHPPSEEDGDDSTSDSLAEATLMWMGQRFQVGPDRVPTDLIRVVQQIIRAEEDGEELGSNRAADDDEKEKEEENYNKNHTESVTATDRGDDNYSEEPILTPNIARRLAQIILAKESVAAGSHGSVLLQSEEGKEEETEAAESMDFFGSHMDETTSTGTRASLLHKGYTTARCASEQLVASLQWNQHQILMTCAKGLLEWAAAANSKRLGME